MASTHFVEIPLKPFAALKHSYPVRASAWIIAFPVEIPLKPFAALKHDSASGQFYVQVLETGRNPT